MFFGNVRSRPAVIAEMMWLEECNDLIRSCGQLSSVLGIQKSFSTSDITQLPIDKTFDTNGMRHIGYINPNAQPRHAISELILNSFQRCNYMLESARLDHTSRSCSTWVAVGELASTSQLPSPHGHCSLSVNQSSSQQQLTASNIITNHSIETSQPCFTAADLIRSVNKKVRENYIRSRLLTTYRAIERLSQSEFNLDQLASVAVTSAPASASASVSASATAAVPASALASALASASASASGPKPFIEGPGPTELVVPIICTSKPQPIIESRIECETDSIKKKNVNLLPKLKVKVNLNPNLTIHDIEEERGKPLSKYDRNMMIFNWLHSLDETATPEE